MKQIVLGLVVSLITALGSSAQAQIRAINIHSTETCVIPKVDGERVPFPLRKANSKFELAEGETYLINGTLVVNGGKILLKVDFESQPWLATEKMRAYPYFEVSSLSTSVVQQHTGRIVQMAVVARREASCSTRENEIKLNPIMPPMAGL